LPFSYGAFDIVMARVLKPGDRLNIIAKVYKGTEAFTSKAAAR
jgi:hypothetical protein